MRSVAGGDEMQAVTPRNEPPFPVRLFSRVGEANKWLRSFEP